MSHILLDVHMLELEIERLVLEYPELAEDEQLRADTIEGETDAFSVLDRIVSGILDAKATEEAQATRIGELQARKAATARRQDAMRRFAHRVMVAGDLKKITLTEKTLSRAKGRDSVEITDETALPGWAFNVKTVKTPSKDSIKEAIDAGLVVPGAQIKTGEEVLRVA